MDITRVPVVAVLFVIVAYFHYDIDDFALLKSLLTLPSSASLLSLLQQLFFLPNLSCYLQSTFPY